jgi:hypothetical protein
MIDTCCRAPMSQALYLTFSAAAADRTTWRLCLEILHKYQIDAKVDQRKQTVTFANGSIMSMLGADDVAHMETFRGGKANLIVIDEVGAMPTRILEPLVDEILEPQLWTTGGALVAIGTPPRVRAGWFADQWFSDGDWKRWHWTGKENTHATGFEEFIARVAARRGVTVDHPSIRREYFAEWVNDTSSSVVPAYSEANTYRPARVRLESVPDGWTTTAAGDELVAIGCDPGSRDRMAVQVVAWREPAQVRQVGEWVTVRDAHTTVGTLAAVLREMLARFGQAPIYVDTSHRMVADTLARDWHIGCVEGAAKEGRQAQLDRLNELAARGALRVAEKSKLDEDLRLTEWDDAKAEPGTYRRYARAWHPDALDAFRYALAHSVLTSPDAVANVHEPVAERRMARFDDYR